MKKKHYFNVTDLNERKNKFDYGKEHSTNIIHDLQEQNIKNKKLKFTSSETKTFIT